MRYYTCSGVVSYAGSYTVSPGTINTSGSGYSLVAIGNGSTLGQVTGFSLGSTYDKSSTTGEMTMTFTDCRPDGSHEQYGSHGIC